MSTLISHMKIDVRPGTVTSQPCPGTMHQPILLLSRYRPVVPMGLTLEKDP